MVFEYPIKHNGILYKIGENVPIGEKSSVGAEPQVTVDVEAEEVKATKGKRKASKAE